jgi:hypothetical protein
MASGFVSNYNDSGYTVPSNWFTENNTQVTVSINSSDIYNTTQQVGCYMVTGSRDYNSGRWFPVFSSTIDLRRSGIPRNDDHGWLIFPGFGFTLFSNTLYNGTITRTYTNTSNTPQFYTCYNGGWSYLGTPIKDVFGNDYLRSSTESMKLYFRGVEIIVPGV